jgi:hypothetical protein
MPSISSIILLIQASKQALSKMHYLSTNRAQDCVPADGINLVYEYNAWRCEGEGEQKLDLLDEISELCDDTCDGKDD